MGEFPLANASEYSNTVELARCRPPHETAVIGCKWASGMAWLMAASQGIEHAQVLKYRSGIAADACVSKGRGNGTDANSILC